jgi:FkbM family methyltransferase
MGEGMNVASNWTTSVRRAFSRRYPLLPYRSRVPLIQGSANEIPAGVVVDTHEGVSVRVEPGGMYTSVYFWGDYEPYNTKIFRRIVRPGDVVFDIGANFGWFTTLFALWVGPSGRVHAFEPVPFIHQLALETLDLNDVGARVQLNRLALGSHDGTLTIHTFAGLPHGHASVSDLGRSDAAAHSCDVRRLDRYCEAENVQRIRFMKIDVEGFEADVFAGGQRMLGASAAPIIAFEVNGECLRARALESHDVIGSLRRLGYTHFYRCSIRRGIESLESDEVDDGDCLAAKPSHLRDLAPVLRTGRVFR